MQALGWKLLASGGTANLLRQNGIQVTEVAEYTGSPEILGGRVKTLHPAIHGGLLARDSDADRDELQAQGWEPIDLAAVNLYPFEQTIARPGVTLEDAIENIDIGGVTLLRAAAKNHARVTVLCDPQDYPAVLAELQAGGVTPETRRRLAVKAFAHTAQLRRCHPRLPGDQESGGLFSEGATPDFFAELASSEPDALELKLYPVESLRYGENPHQSATLYAYQPEAGPLGGKVLQGKALSYNNLLDLDAAWRAVISFGRPAIVIVKHLSPCGMACADTLVEAFHLALASDPVSAFGGVIAANRPFDGETAEALGELFRGVHRCARVHCRGPGDAGAAQEPAPGGYARPRARAALRAALGQPGRAAAGDRPGRSAAEPTGRW